MSAPPLDRHDLASLLDFDTMFGMLERFKEQHGHCRVPPVGTGGENVLLFSWTELQRARLYLDKIGSSEEEIDHLVRLDSIGFWATTLPTTTTAGQNQAVSNDINTQANGIGGTTGNQHHSELGEAPAPGEEEMSIHSVSIKEEPVDDFYETNTVPTPSPLLELRAEHQQNSPPESRMVESSPMIIRAVRQEDDYQQQAIRDGTPEPILSPTTAWNETSLNLQSESTAAKATASSYTFTTDLREPNKEDGLVESLREARRVSEAPVPPIDLVDRRKLSAQQTSPKARVEEAEGIVTASHVDGIETSNAIEPATPLRALAKRNFSSAFLSGSKTSGHTENTTRSTSTGTTVNNQNCSKKIYSGVPAGDSEGSCPISSPIPKKRRSFSTQYDSPGTAPRESSLFDLEPLPRLENPDWMFARARMASNYRRCGVWGSGKCRYGKNCYHAHVFEVGLTLESMVIPLAKDLEVFRRINSRHNFFYTAGYRQGNQFVYARGGGGRSCPLGVYWYNSENEAKQALLDVLSDNIVCQSKPDRNFEKIVSLPPLNSDWLFEDSKYTFPKRCGFFRPNHFCRFGKICKQAHVYSPGTPVHDIHYNEENLKEVERSDAFGNRWYTAGYMDSDQSTFFYAIGGKGSVQCAQSHIFWYRDPVMARTAVLSVLQKTGCLYGYDSSTTQHEQLIAANDDPVLI